MKILLALILSLAPTLLPAARALQPQAMGAALVDRDDDGRAVLRISSTAGTGITTISGAAATSYFDKLTTSAAVTQAQLTTTALVGRRWVSSTAVALTTADYLVNLSAAAGTSTAPTTVILGHTGACAELFFAITNAVTTPVAYQYVSASALPIALPNNASGSILHEKVTTSCGGANQISVEGQ